jgi:hypothetical protein
MGYYGYLREAIKTTQNQEVLANLRNTIIHPEYTYDNSNPNHESNLEFKNTLDLTDPTKCHIFPIRINHPEHYVSLVFKYNKELNIWQARLFDSGEDVHQNLIDELSGMLSANNYPYIVDFQCDNAITIKQTQGPACGLISIVNAMRFITGKEKEKFIGDDNSIRRNVYRCAKELEDFLAGGKNVPLATEVGNNNHPVPVGTPNPNDNDEPEVEKPLPLATVRPVVQNKKVPTPVETDYAYFFPSLAENLTILAAVAVVSLPIAAIAAIIVPPIGVVSIATLVVLVSLAAAALVAASVAGVAWAAEEGVIDLEPVLGCDLNKQPNVEKKPNLSNNAPTSGMSPLKTETADLGFGR